MRRDGFAQMDVSTAIVEDGKFRQIAREHSEMLPTAFMAYVATMGASWQEERRVPILEAWPLLVPWDAAIVAELSRVGLLDDGGCIPAATWDRWFVPAQERRDAARDRWARANAKRRKGASRLPRGNDAATATTVRPTVLPSIPPVRPSVRNDDGANAHNGGPMKTADILPGIVPGLVQVDGQWVVRKAEPA